MVIVKDVLIVEDDVIISMVLGKMVEKLGFNVIGTVSEGKKAIEDVFTTQPDIILMDIELADSVNGIEVTKRIQKTLLDISIIYVSGSSNYEEQGREMGCIDFLKKPVTMNELQHAFQKYLDQTNTN